MEFLILYEKRVRKSTLNEYPDLLYGVNELTPIFK